MIPLYTLRIKTNQCYNCNQKYKDKNLAFEKKDWYNYNLLKENLNNLKGFAQCNTCTYTKWRNSDIKEIEKDLDKYYPNWLWIQIFEKKTKNYVRSIYRQGK